MITDELKKEAEEWLRSTDNHLNEEKTHFLSESEYAERAYLAGAEPREKHIAELEDLIHAERKRQEQCDDIHLKKIAELEKENAELKKENLILHEMNLKRIEYYNLLTKAKELLERLLITSCNSDVLNLLPNCSEVLKVRVEAEQFLNSEVEK